MVVMLQAAGSLRKRRHAGRLEVAVASIMAAGGLALALPDAHSAEFRANPENYRGHLRGLQPGDRLLLAAGDYEGGLSVHGLHGTREQPVQIRALDAQRRPRFLGRQGRNTVSIVDSAFVEIADLDLDGRDVPVDAVKAEGHARYAHHITLRNLYIAGHGASQSTIGISTKCPAWNWVIRDNVVVGAGTGMYLGDSDGSAPFVAGLIEGNVILDTIGYNLQIKHQKVRPALPGMPLEASATVIRRNVFRKGPNAATGEWARPNLLVGHFPPSGPGAEDTYLIYGNFFYRNATEALFQGEGNIALYSNVLINPEGSAVHVQPHNALPERIDIFQNTILARDSGLRVIGGDPRRVQRVQANLVFAGQPLTGGAQRANVVGDWSQAGTFLRSPYGEVEQIDLRPHPGALPTLPPELGASFAFTEADLDFDGRRRLRQIAGAFEDGERMPLPLTAPRRLVR